MVAEGLVAFAHRLAETALGGAADEVVALLRVAGDPVEEGPEHLGLVQALRVEGLIDEHLHHHQLVDRQPGYALEEVGSGGSHQLVSVSLGLFDDADGLVQVTGSGVAAGQKIVVPNT